MSTNKATVAIFTLAGLATAQGFMDVFRDELSRQLHSRGLAVSASASLYPYGDWSRRAAYQLLEIARDLTDIHEKVWRSVGAGAAREQIMQAAQAGHTVLLIGHSGGGVTAVQIARQLISAGHKAPLVVQIGSPKCPVPVVWKDRVLYLSLVGEDGRRSDPVTRFGRWGGWVSGRSRVALWKRNAYAPGAIIGLPLIGSHPDYFRMQPPYVNEEGRSNMNQTVGAIMEWLERRLF
ncbi:hypothetical protein DVH26_06385 [Paenibacillus sp. H1-7]|uniref:hypothetical protein n=1 Tax=Paenibacillus sp. H1-7 TaxID=2282849 RepID=UPI001EF788AA|nr:hypothetical protein [Paenibacillus sp. H1-7]ULL14104.1 hypothetical protein DVH26_06385 [Paenibacillus sp. H1-7]